MQPIRITFAATLPLLIAACETPAPGGAAAEAEPAAASSAATGQIAMPAGITGEEVTIWNSLSAENKKRAAEFIANGGTFREFYSL